MTDATDVDKLQQLADRVRNVYDKACFCSLTYGVGIMRANLLLRIALWLVEKKFGHTTPLWRKMPDLADSYIESLIDHMLNGKDTSGSDAVGGFNQREIHIIMGAIHLCRSEV